jgi:hypothetical protein
LVAIVDSQELPLTATLVGEIDFHGDDNFDLHEGALQQSEPFEYCLHGNGLYQILFPMLGFYSRHLEHSH